MTDSPVRMVFSADQIQAVVRRLAAQIDTVYADTTDLVLVCVLRGAVYFLADLSRAMKTRHRIDFVEYASYRGTEKGSGSLVKDATDPIAGADVLIVDEILDTGETLATLIAHLAHSSPRSIAACVLFTKRPEQWDSPGERSTSMSAMLLASDPTLTEAPGATEIAGTDSHATDVTGMIASGAPPAPTFVGFEVGAEFLVGYGLDHDQRLRHLPYVGILESAEGGLA